jgi:hypothetical protein
MIDSALSNNKTIKELEKELKNLHKKRNDINFHLKKFEKKEKKQKYYILHQYHIN